MWLAFIFLSEQWGQEKFVVAREDWPMASSFIELEAVKTLGDIIRGRQEREWHTLEQHKKQWLILRIIPDSCHWSAWRRDNRL